MTPHDATPSQTRQRSSLPLVLAAGGSCFVIGIGLSIGYMQWQDQRNELARVSAILESLQQGGGFASDEAVTRNVPLSGLSLYAPEQALAPAPATKPAQGRTAVLAGLVQQATGTATGAQAPEVAEQIAPLAPKPVPAVAPRPADRIISAARAQIEAQMELMGAAVHGMKELAAAAVAGDYTLDADDTFANGKAGKLRLAFPRHARDQAQLEQLLADAAKADLIAFNPSVRGSDGTYDGPLILFDLLENYLSKGTPEERATAEAIREKSAALLAKYDPMGDELPTPSGQQYYTVEPGDSLAFISLQFYGRTNDFLKIFEANRSFLTSPERIQIGQRLLIPEA